MQETADGRLVLGVTLLQMGVLGPVSIARLMKAFDSVDALRAAGPALVRTLIPPGGRTDVMAVVTDPSTLDKAHRSAHEVLSRDRELGIEEVPFYDARYPRLLSLIPDFPPILFVRGRSECLKSTRNVAVVGTREPTPTGRARAPMMASYFAAKGYVVVSGFAKGIDTAAHRGAIEAGGITVGVLGGPLDKLHPAENRHLMMEALERGGCLLSEKPLGNPATKADFIRRDRIQAGLSLGVIAVQAGINSGTMHTALFAKRYGRPVFCPVPPEREMKLPQYEGIKVLVEKHGATYFTEDALGTVEARIAEMEARLLHEFSAVPKPEPRQQPPCS
ncbi:MAG: DNA-protecting protein DprA [Clostridia bacterium]|nr:DNA-protecting protein DprA [Clostridia bacterium]